MAFPKPGFETYGFEHIIRITYYLRFHLLCRKRVLDS
jgi:hypothetical protein